MMSHPWCCTREGQLTFAGMCGAAIAVCADASWRRRGSKAGLWCSERRIMCVQLPAALPPGLAQSAQSAVRSTYASSGACPFSFRGVGETSVARCHHMNVHTACPTTVTSLQGLGRQGEECNQPRLHPCNRTGRCVGPWCDTCSAGTYRTAPYTGTADVCRAACQEARPQITDHAVNQRGLAAPRLLATFYLGGRDMNVLFVLASCSMSLYCGGAPQLVNRKSMPPSFPRAGCRLLAARITKTYVPTALLRLVMYAVDCPPPPHTHTHRPARWSWRSTWWLTCRAVPCHGMPCRAAPLPPPPTHRTASRLSGRSSFRCTSTLCGCRYGCCTKCRQSWST